LFGESIYVVIKLARAKEEYEKTFEKIMTKAPKLSVQTNTSRHQKPRSSVMEDAVSAKLKAYYAEMEHQDVPKSLLDLLDKLDKSVN
jgi:DNA-binding protein Fis